MAIIARGGDGGILQRENRMRRPALCVRRFDRNAPRLAVRPETHRAHLAIDPDEGVGYSVVAQGFGKPVHAVTLGYAVQIQRYGSELADAVAFELQSLMRRAAQAFFETHQGEQALVRFAQALLNLNEFVYLE